MKLDTEVWRANMMEKRQKMKNRLARDWTDGGIGRRGGDCINIILNIISASISI
jgi:hypothetical protein